MSDETDMRDTVDHYRVCIKIQYRLHYLIGDYGRLTIPIKNIYSYYGIPQELAEQLCRLLGLEMEGC